MDTYGPTPAELRAASADFRAASIRLSSIADTLRSQITEANQTHLIDPAVAAMLNEITTRWSTRFQDVGAEFASNAEQLAVAAEREARRKRYGHDLEDHDFLAP